MGLIDRLMVGAEEATAGARDTVHDTQIRHELGQAYGELGRAAYALVRDGGPAQTTALRDPRVTAAVERVRGLESRLAQSAASEAHGT